MTLHAFDIPDDPAELPTWLESHIHGLDLASLVAELTAVHGPEGTAPVDLEELLGARKEAVLSDGLGALPAETLRQFLVRPRLLLQLQELVLCEGGPYWDRIAADVEQDAHVQRGAARLQAFLSAETASVRLTPAQRTRWYRRPWFVSLATAASVLAAMFSLEPLRRRPPDNGDRPPPELAAAPWGWNRPNALPENASRTEYLNRLADEAGEWFEQRPTDAAAVARRIQELRAGCTRLIFAQHRPLPPSDQEQLIENCRIWGRKLDKQIAALESGQNALEVRGETDELIRQIIDRLHEQAKKAA